MDRSSYSSHAAGGLTELFSLLSHLSKKLPRKLYENQYESVSLYYVPLIKKTLNMLFWIVKKKKKKNPQNVWLCFHGDWSLLLLNFVWAANGSEKLRKLFNVSESPYFVPTTLLRCYLHAIQFSLLKFTESSGFEYSHAVVDRSRQYIQSINNGDTV